MLKELSHVLPSIAPVQLDALQTTVPQLLLELRFVNCALMLPVKLVTSVTLVLLQQQWEHVF
jgi:hypothetical protein